MICTVGIEQPTPPHGITPRIIGYSSPPLYPLYHTAARRSTCYTQLPRPHPAHRLGGPQVFVQATEGMLSTSRFATTRLGQQKHAALTSSDNPAVGGADGGPSRNEDSSPDPYGDGANERRSGTDGTGSGRRSNSLEVTTTTDRGVRRGWVLTMIDSHAAASGNSVVYYLVQLISLISDSA